MKNKSTKAVKPLTKIMVDVLLDCAEKELMKVDPCDVGTTRSAKGLIERQLVTPKIFVNSSGKRVMSLYLTELGHEYINNFS
jgi:peptidyl-tRNA hydrolase